MNFPSHLYTIVPGQGFGPTQPHRHYGAPLPCPTFEPIKPDEEARWGTPKMSHIFLGPGQPEELWLHGAKSGSLLVLYGGDTRDSERYGYAVLNLWPLCGVSATLTHSGGRQVDIGSARINESPSPELAAMLVGKALAGAWSEHSRIAVIGPTWALDVLATIPGAVVFNARYHHNDKGTCIAWGRRWTVDGSQTPSPFQIAQRLSWRSPYAFVANDRAIGSLLLGNYHKTIRVRAVADGKQHWRVESQEFGTITIQVDGRDRYSGSDPPARWPSADDPWLVDFVGDGEPVVPDDDDDAA